MLLPPGDILHEANYKFGDLGGHTSIFAGRVYSNYGYYYQTIEAVGNLGVIRGALDDERFLQRKGYLLYVPSATIAQRVAALNFCVGQLGKAYDLDLKKDTSASELDWYCSELVWAGYKNQGIDIEVNVLGVRGQIGITPTDIYNCKKTSIFLTH